jgi:hypothetical protein
VGSMWDWSAAAQGGCSRRLQQVEAGLEQLDALQPLQLVYSLPSSAGAGLAAWHAAGPLHAHGPWNHSQTRSSVSILHWWKQTLYVQLQSCIAGQVHDTCWLLQCSQVHHLCTASEPTLE